MLHGIRPAVAHQIHLLFYPLLLSYLSRADLMLLLPLGSTAAQKHASTSLNHDRERAPRYFQEVNQIARNFLHVLLR